MTSRAVALRALAVSKRTADEISSLQPRIRMAEGASIRSRDLPLFVVVPGDGAIRFDGAASSRRRLNSSEFRRGFRRSSLVEKIRFNNIAQGSGEEARYYLILAADLGYGDPTSISAILDEALSLLEGYTRALRKKLEKQNLRREVSGIKAMK